jgi:hypothetical protein
VKGGVVQKKNNATSTGDYYLEAMTHWKFEQSRPSPGFKHVVSKRDLDRFIEIVPDFEELSRGLDAIILRKGSDDFFGLYRSGWTQNGTIHLSAWRSEMYLPMSKELYEAHPELMERLNVPYDEDDPLVWRTYHFTKETARVFMLLDVFLQELGHHHDRVTSKRKKRCGRGESYAEEIARTTATKLWPEYLKRFEV